MSEKHNGWANYETFIVYTWMNNEEKFQRLFMNMWEESYEQAKEQPYFTKEEEAVVIMAENLKSYFEDWMYNTCDDIPGVFKDLLNGALSDVDWHEIASHSAEGMEVQYSGEFIWFDYICLFYTSPVYNNGLRLVRPAQRGETPSVVAAVA